jgi:YD repeat-containing protein
MTIKLRAPRLALLWRLLLIGMPAPVLWGQVEPSSSDGITPAMLAPGTPAGSYELSGFDTVNLANGHVNFTLPLAMAYGRGGMKVPLVWNQQGEWTAYASPAGCNLPNGPPYCSGWSVATVFGPRYTNYANFGGVLRLRQNGDTCTQQPNTSSNWWKDSLTTVYFVAPDGTETEFVDTLTGGAIENNPFFSGPFTNRGSTFRAVDGSDAMVTTASAVVDDPIGCGTGDGPIGGTMTLRDGTTYTFSTSVNYLGYVQQIEDRNGNVIDIPNPDPYAGETVTDALNRSITAAVVSYGPPDSYGRASVETITYPGSGGAQRQVIVSSACTGQETLAGNGAWVCGGNGNPTQVTTALPSHPTRYMLRSDKQIQTFPNLFSFSGSSGYFNAVLPFEILLPDGTAYEIYYDSYGNIARVELPTGAPTNTITRSTSARPQAPCTPIMTHPPRPSIASGSTSARSAYMARAAAPLRSK